METVEGLLGTVRVGDPDFHVAQLGAGTASLAVGDRWSLVAVARGRVGVLDTTLGPGDAVLGRGRGVLAARPAEPGTAVLVARFALHGAVHRVGAAPLSYVREHRLDVAERALLREPDTTVAAVARRVGYANPFSFSAAFRRHRGVAPSELRRPPATDPAPGPAVRAAARGGRSVP